MKAVRPVLVDWSARYDHLREVTRNDVAAALATMHGSRRMNTLVGLRSLFAYCKKSGTVFRNPTAGIKVGQQEYGVVQPLQPSEVDQAIATATTPAARLILAQAAVHAARAGAIRALLVDDVDLGNRRLVIAGRVRPLDDLTRHILLDWLAYRRTRWPSTPNPHLIINQQTAVETGPVSTFWAKKALRGQTATLERLRVDRQLEEALVRAPTHSTSRPYSGSTRKPPFATRLRPVSCSSLGRKSLRPSMRGTAFDSPHPLPTFVRVHREPKGPPHLLRRRTLEFVVRNLQFA